MGKKVLGVLGLLVVFILGALCVTNCDRIGSLRNVDRIDSAFVAEYVKSTVNPVFTSPEEVVSYQKEQLSNDELQFEFLNIDPDILKTVATVVLKRSSIATKEDIVKEYSEKADVYNNLPPLQSQNIDITTSSETVKSDTQQSGMEDQRVTGVGTVSYKEKDTVIDGTKAKVLTREEIQYE